MGLRAVNAEGKSCNNYNRALGPLYYSHIRDYGVMVSRGLPTPILGNGIDTSGTQAKQPEPSKGRMGPISRLRSCLW